MHGDGPTSGEPYDFGIIAATDDALSMDFHLARMLGAKLDEYSLYRAAKSRGLSQCELDDHDVCGDLDADHVFRGVKLPRTQTMRLLPSIPFLDRLMTSRPVHVPEKCIGCGRCAAVCTAGALKHENRRLSFDYAKCIRCYCCHEMCPVKAIEFRESRLVKLVNALTR